MFKISLHSILTSLMSWDNLDSSPVIPDVEGDGFTGDSKWPRKLLNEKSATSEFSHWFSFSLRIREGLDGGVEFGASDSKPAKQQMFVSNNIILVLPAVKINFQIKLQFRDKDKVSAFF